MGLHSICFSGAISWSQMEKHYTDEKNNLFRTIKTFLIAVMVKVRKMVTSVLAYVTRSLALTKHFSFTRNNRGLV